MTCGLHNFLSCAYISTDNSSGWDELGWGKASVGLGVLKKGFYHML